MSTDNALMIIDAQVNMFEEGNSVYEGERILHTLRHLIDQARSAHLPVIFVQNNGGDGDPDVHGTSGWQIHPAIAPEPGDIVIQKHTPDSFYETELQTILEKHGIRKLVIAGMQTDFCVNATCRRAHALGYEVTLVQDGHSTFDGSKLKAAEVIAQYNDALGKEIHVEEMKNIAFE